MANETVSLTEEERKATKKARHAVYMRDYYARNKERWLARKRTRDRDRRSTLTRQQRETRNRKKKRDPDAFNKKQAAKTAGWRAANPDKTRAAKLRRHHREMQASGYSRYRLVKTLRGRIHMAIKSGTKTGGAVRDLGCTIEQFRIHIERQFSKGMSWENWGNGEGKWNLDHIRPLAIFDLTDPSQFRAAVHFTNYRPLWWRENLKKGATLAVLL